MPSILLTNSGFVLQKSKSQSSHAQTSLSNIRLCTENAIEVSVDSSVVMTIFTGLWYHRRKRRTERQKSQIHHYIERLMADIVTTFTRRLVKKRNEMLVKPQALIRGYLVRKGMMMISRRNPVVMISSPRLSTFTSNPSNHKRS
jgi:hypothetical protein